MKEIVCEARQTVLEVVSEDGYCPQYFTQYRLRGLNEAVHELTQGERGAKHSELYSIIKES